LRLRKGLLTLLVKTKEGNKTQLKKKLEVSLVELDSIIFSVRGSSVSIAALIEASKHGIDIVIMDNWRPIARLIPARYSGFLRLWHSQLKAHTSNRKIELAKTLAEGKLKNQRANLLYFSKTTTDKKLHYQLRNAADNINKTINNLTNSTTIDEVRQHEAEGARWYWNTIKQLIPKNLGFKKRLKRFSLPPGIEPDPFNKALNIGYGILQKEVWRATFTVGLNPYIGFLHKPRPGRMSLVLDLMEEFRPLIDRTLITMARKETNKILKLNNKDTEQEGIIDVVKQVLTTLNKTRDNIWTQARRLANTILNNEQYQPYRLPY